MSKSVSQNQSVTDSVTQEDRSFSMLASLDRQDKNLSRGERERRRVATNRVALAYWETINNQQQSSVTDDRLVINQGAQTTVDSSYQAYLESVELESRR